MNDRIGSPRGIEGRIERGRRTGEAKRTAPERRVCRGGGARGSKLVAAFGAAWLAAVAGLAAEPCIDRALRLDPVSYALQSNRFDLLRDGVLQIVALHDGSGVASLTIELESPDDGTIYALEVSLEATGARIGTQIGAQIGTWEFDVYDLRPTGRFEIRGVVPDGGVDGIAFGGLWRDEAGYFRAIRSFDKEPLQRASFVGLWPYDLAPQAFAERTPQLETAEAKRHARSLLTGAKLLVDGCYHLRQRAD